MDTRTRPAPHDHDHDHEHDQTHRHGSESHGHPAPGKKHDHAHRHDHGHGHADACCGATALPPASPAPAGGTRRRIPDMDCAVEANEIRGLVEGLPGVDDLHFDLKARVLTISADAEAAAQAFARIEGAGFRTQALDTEGEDGAAAHAPLSGQPGLPRLIAALVLALAAEATAFAAPEGLVAQGLGMGMAAAAIALSGFDVYRKGLVALRHGRLNINALMTVAVTGAALIGQWPEAAMVMALYAIAELIEARAAERARGAIRDLLDTGPDQTLARQADGSWQPKAIGEILSLIHI